MSPSCMICDDNDAKCMTDLMSMSFLKHFTEINSQIRKIKCFWLMTHPDVSLWPQGRCNSLVLTEAVGLSSQMKRQRRGARPLSLWLPSPNALIFGEAQLHHPRFRTLHLPQFFPPVTFTPCMRHTWALGITSGPALWPLTSLDDHEHKVTISCPSSV